MGLMFLEATDRIPSIFLLTFLVLTNSQHCSLPTNVCWTGWSEMLLLKGKTQSSKQQPLA